MKENKLKATVEAALFMSNEPISVDKISKLIRAEKTDIERTIGEIKRELESDSHGFHIIETATGYQMRVKPQYAQSVRQLTPYQDLSRGLLRVLALVAYKQPITQSNVVKVIGNRTYEYVKRLVGRGLIKTEKFGRTKKLIATKEFANYFGLESPEDIKRFFDEMTKDEKKESEVSSE